MSKARWAQAGLAALVIVGLWIGFGAVQTDQQGEAIMRWVPAGSADLPGPETEAIEAAPVAPPLSVNSLGAISGPAAGEKPVVKKPDPPEPPVPAAQPEPKSYPPLKPAVAAWIKDLIQAQLDSGLGYRVNDLIVGRLADNETNRQAGEIEAIQSYLSLLCEQARPRGRTDEVRRHLLEADLKKWWFPRAEKSLARGVRALEAMTAEIEAGGLQLPGDRKALKKHLELLAGLLEREQTRLLEEGIGFTQTDDRFYHARGVGVVCQNALQGIMTGFEEAVKDSGVEPELTEALAWLGRAGQMKPLIVMAGDLDGLRANHLVSMAHLLKNAEDRLRAAALKIKRPPAAPPDLTGG